MVQTAQRVNSTAFSEDALVVAAEYPEVQPAVARLAEAPA
jgi:hypothetical protein